MNEIITSARTIGIDNSVDLSNGQETQLMRRTEGVLQVVTTGAVVAIEGTPINLDRLWAREHAFGYNHVLLTAMQQLAQRCCNVEHVVLLDDYTVVPCVSPDEYLSRIVARVDRVEMESSFASRAQEISDQIGRKVRRSDWRPIDLITSSGRFCCPLLDAAFQETKYVDFNILIHPIEYKHEQDEMRAIILAARAEMLPFTLVNIFFKGLNLNKVFVTEPNGRTERVL